jgi:hypothetical protein
MKTSFKEGEKVGIKGQSDLVEIIQILPYGIVIVKEADGAIRNVHDFDLNEAEQGQNELDQHEGIEAGEVVCGRDGCRIRHQHKPTHFGVKAGEVCGRNTCDGIIRDCDCGAYCYCPNDCPCTYCTDKYPYCPECGWNIHGDEYQD